MCCDTDHDSHDGNAEQHVPQRIHTIHHHHIQKQTILKKIKVPVIKEVKVPYYIYEPIKVPYHYILKPYIVKVPIEYQNEEKHEDVYEPMELVDHSAEEEEDGGSDESEEEHKE